MSNTNVPLVSILVRSMDRPTLNRTLDSIAAQDYPHIEIVVVAACGPTHRDLPESYGPFPLRLVRTRRSLPRAEAANAAVDSSRGEWLNLLDDDDLFLPHHVSTLQTALAENPSTRLGYAKSMSIDGHAGLRTEFGARFKPWRQLDTGFFHSQAALFSRSLIDEGARFDPAFDILEDMDFFVQCAQRTPFVFVEQVTSVSYRDAGTSGTGTQHDPVRVNSAIARLRAKWSALESRLRASPEFRLEYALWAIEQNQLSLAKTLLDGVLSDRPDWPDALNAVASLALRRSASRGPDVVSKRIKAGPAVR